MATGIFAVLITLGLVLVPAPSAVAAVGIYKTINFQGKVTNANGTNVVNGTYSFTFSLYTVASAGTNIWTETKSLTVTDGVFQTNLGSVTSLPGSVDFNTDNIFLGMNFNLDGEMSPRIQFTASAYAFNSDKLQGLSAAAFAQLSPASAQSGSLNVTGSVQAATSLQAPLVDTATAAALSIGTATATSLTLGRTTTPFLMQGNSSSTFSATSGVNTTTVSFAAPTAARSIVFPDAGGTLCTTTATTCSATYQAASTTGYILKNAQDTSSASTLGSLLGLTNTNAGAAGVLSLSNAGTNSTLSVSQTGNPTAGQALILVNNTNATPSGNLIDLQVAGTSKLAIDVSGNVTQTGATATTATINGQRISAAANFTGTVTAATSLLAPLLATTDVVAGTSAGVILRSGNGTAGGAGSGNVTIDAGSKNAAGLTGNVNIATINASALTLGRSGLQPSFPGGFTANGPVLIQPATDSTSIFNVKSSATGTNGNEFTVDTVNGRVGINLGPSLPTLTGSGLEIGGALRLSGGFGALMADSFTTPVGSSVSTKINVPLFDPGNFGQIVALGLPASASISARVLSALDARTVAHQPTLAVFSPDENNVVGFSWEGSNASTYLKTTGGNLIVRSGATDLITALSGGNVGIGLSPGYKLDVAGDANISSGSVYRINGTQICAITGCTPASGSTNYIQNGTLQQASSNFNISGTGTAATSILAPLLATVDVVSGTSAGVTLRSGNGTAGGAGSGNVTIDTGSKNGVGLAGNVNIGTTNTANVTIGRNSATATGTTISLQGLASSSSFVFNNAANTFATTIGFTTPSAANSIVFPDASGTVCTTVVSTCSATYNAAGSFLQKNVNDTSAASFLGNLYSFTNSNSGGAGVLSLINSGSSAALSVSASSNATAGQALILATNTNVTPSGNLIDLRVTAGSRFSVDTTGAVTTSSTINGQTISAAASFTGSVTSATGISVTAGGITVGGNSNITGTLGVSNTLTVSANGASITGGINNNAGGITGAGAISGLSSLQYNTNGTLDTSAANSITIGGTNANTITIGKSTATQPTVSLQGGTGSAFTITSGANSTSLAFSALSAGGKTVSIPNETGTICTSAVSSNSNCTNYAPSTLGTGYIQNQIAGQQSASNFWISSVGRTDGAFLTPTLDTPSAAVLNIGTSGSPTTTAINLNQNTTIATGKSFTANGAITQSGGAFSLAGNGPSSLSTTAGNALSITSAAAATWSTGAGALTIQGFGGTSITTPAASGAVTSTITVATGNVTSGAFASGNITVDTGTSTGTTGTITIGGTSASAVNLGHTGVAVVTGGTAQVGTSAGNGALLNNGSTVNTSYPMGNLTIGGWDAGGASATVDKYTYITANQAATGQTLTPPTPTASATYGRVVYLTNGGTASFTLLGTTIGIGSTATLLWANINGVGTWTFAGADGNGILNQNTSDQTANFRISGTGRANTSVTTPLIDSITGGLNVGTGTATGITIGGAATTGVIGIGTAAASTLNIGTGAFAHTIAIGTDSTTVQGLTVGSTNASSVTTLQAGSAINLNAATVATNQATVNLFNATATTVNEFAAATTINVGAANAVVTYGNGGAATLRSTTGALTITSAAAATWSTGTGTLTVDSAAALNLGTGTATSVAIGRSTTAASAPGNVTVGTVGTTIFKNNGATQNAVCAYTGVTGATTLNAASKTPDVCTAFTLVTTGVAAITVPVPAAGAGSIVYISVLSSSTNAVTLLGAILGTGSTATLVYNGTVWTYAGADASNLQTVYNNSSDPELLLGTASTAGLSIRDNAAAIAGNLLEVQNSAGTVNYLAVTSAAAQVTGNILLSAGATRTIQIIDQPTTATAGDALIVKSAAGNTSGAGGLLSLIAGAGGATGAGGAVTVQGGAGGATSGNGGLVTVQGGSATTAAGSVGGAVAVQGGNAAATAGSQGGAVTITGGGGTSTGTGAAGSSVTITGGAAGGSGNNAGGNATVAGGAATGSGTGGITAINGGAASAIAGSNGGGVTITAAQGSSTGTGGVGGSILLTGGNGTGSGNNNGGSIQLTPGIASGSGIPGVISIDTPVFTASALQAYAVDTTVSTALIDTNSTLLVTVSAIGRTITIPAPTNNATGRIVYVTVANGSNAFTLSPSGGPSINLSANSTAMLVWNGAQWTASASASSLQQTYNNTSTSPASIVTTSTTKTVLIKAGATFDAPSIFEVQNAASTSIFSIDSSTTTIAIGAAGNAATFTPSTGFTLSGTARHPKNIRLTAEYAGAVLDIGGQASVTGTMTAGYDATPRFGYYKWTTGLATANTYDIVVSIPLPDDWAAWNGNPSIKDYASSIAAGNTINVINMTRTDGTADTTFAATPVNITPGSTSTWATYSAKGLDATGYTAGGTMTLRIRMSSTSNSDMRLGDINLPYWSKY